MGRRGTKPKPTELKILQGTHPCRINFEAPVPPRGEPQRPLDLDDDGNAAWDDITAKLKMLGILTDVDGASIAVYCKAYSRNCKANRSIENRGLLLRSGNTYRANPACNIANTSERIMMSMLSEMGLTPAARSRVKVDRTAKDDLGEFLAKEEQA